MSDQKPKWLTRKDLAQKLELSIAQVRDNERNLGLDKARVDVNKRNVRFDSGIAERELRSRRLLP
jgi:hypothetical protein